MAVRPLQSAAVHARTLGSTQWDHGPRDPQEPKASFEGLVNRLPERSPEGPGILSPFQLALAVVRRPGHLVWVDSSLSVLSQRTDLGPGQGAGCTGW